MLLHSTSRAPRSTRTARVALLAAVVAVAALAGAALQAPPSVAGVRAPTLTTSPPMAHPQQRVGIVGSGFEARETVAVTLDAQPLGSAETDGSGVFVLPFTVPADATYGPHPLAATGQTSGAVAETSLTVRNNWAQFMRAGPHQGWNPYERTLTRDNVADLALAWRFDDPAGCRSYSGPSVVNGRVYLGSYCGRLYAVDEATGALLWRRSLGGRIDGVPAVSHHRLFVATADHDNGLYALDAETGVRLWGRRLGTDGSTSSTIVRDALVYQTDGDGHVLAVRAKSGTLRWQHRLPGTLVGSIVVTDGVVYVGSTSGYVYALDARSGHLRWRGRAGSPVRGSVVRADDLVVAATRDHALVAFARHGCGKATCAPAWRSRGSAPGTGTPAVAYDTIYAAEGRTTSDEGYLDAFPVAGCGADVCDPTWQAPLLGGRAWRGGAVAARVVYLTTADNRVVALDSSSGAQLWTYQEPSGDDRGNAELAVTDGTLFVNLVWSRALLAFRVPPPGAGG